MITINSIINEMQKVPVEKLEELYLVVRSFNFPAKGTKQQSEKILEFAGLFDSMSDEEYDDFSASIDLARANMFNRSFTI